MADPDREIREAVLGTDGSDLEVISQTVSRGDLIDGLCALRRVLQRDQGGVPAMPVLAPYVGQLARYGVPTSLIGDIDEAITAAIAAAVAAARRQP